MKKRLTPFAAALLIFVVGASCLGFRQDDSVVTAQEKAQVQEFAKQFVARLLQTRDVAPLIPEFFLNDFTALSRHDFYEKVVPELYAKLSTRERVRLFVAQENLGYLITLDVLTQVDKHSSGADPPPFNQILPGAIARRLSRSRLVEGTATFTDRRRLMKELVALERSLRKARPYLKKRDLEHSPRFVEAIQRFEKNPYLGYRVRASLIDEDDLRREVGLQRFAVGQKVFSVDTPILIELVLINDGGRFRILTLLPADDD